MAATSSDRRDFDDSWVFERKLDGVRCLAWVDAGQVSLRSRNNLPYDASFPEIARSLERRAKGVLLVDGELVAMEEGRTSFSRLQHRLGTLRTDIEVQYVVFDLLWFGGHDIRSLPLESRQGALREVIDYGGPLVRSDALPGDARTLMGAACGLGWEGLVAKRLGSAYQPRRSRDWLKLKCSASQEVVVGGFTAPQGSRSGFGALLVGVYEGDELRFAGKVGTGFDDATLSALHAELRSIERSTTPFVDEVREPTARWVEPSMVVQVGFGEWTPTDRLRHPKYLGRRHDTDPTAVIREPPSW